MAATVFVNGVTLTDAEWFNDVDNAIYDEIINVKNSAYGAVGDGSNDDTTAIQTAIAASLTSLGSRLFFPPGTYKITAALTIPSSTGWKIFGASRASTTIKQFTDNTPIFNLTACDTHSWNISDLSFNWNAAQPSTNTSAIAIYLSGATGTPGNGYYNFQVERVTFSNGFRAITNNQSIQLSTWGYALRDWVVNGNMSGSAVNFQQSPAVGCPNVTLEKFYIRCDAMRETAIDLRTVNGMRIADIEFNQATLGGAGTLNGNLMLIQTCRDVVIENVRSESITHTTTARAQINLVQTSATLSGIQVDGVVVSTAITAFGISAGTGAFVSISGYHSSATLSGGGSFFMVTGDTYKRLENYSGTGITAAIDPSNNTIIYDDLRYQKPAVQARGDVAVVLTVADRQTQYFNTQLTANRDVTLPSASVTEGMRFEITRYVATPGAFTLRVVDPLSGKNITIAANTKGWATYVASSSGEWVPVSTGTFP